MHNREREEEIKCSRSKTREKEHEERRENMVELKKETKSKDLYLKCLIFQSIGIQCSLISYSVEFNGYRNGFFRIIF